MVTMGECVYYLFYFFALALFCAVTMTVLYYAAYALVCALAWIEDEAERAKRARQRRARMRIRAREYRAGMFDR